MSIRHSLSNLHGIFLLGGALLALSGCQPPRTGPEFRALPGGTFDNVGAVIEEPGGFRIVGGQSFTTPFAIDCTRLDATSDGWRAALAAGAQRVAIYLPGQPRFYGGVLALCTVHKTAYGPASLSYQLVIPADRIGDAQDGLVASLAQQVAVNRVVPLNLQDVSQILLSPPGTVPTQPQVITADFAWMLWFTDRPEFMGVNFQPTGVAVPPPPSRGAEIKRVAPPLTAGGSYTVGVALNLRAGPGASSAIVAHLSQGDAVIASGEQKNGYWAVTTAGGQSGWVAARNLKAN
jgi:hypothetical protein